MHLHFTIDVLSRQIEVAENKVIASVERYMPDANEEEITKEFQRCLGEVFDEANNENEFSNAFSSDLAAIGAGDEFSFLSAGLIAKVAFHPRHVEAETQGDFGLVLIRPKMETTSGGTELILAKKVGLLAQAKKVRIHGQSGAFTENQESLFAERSNYSAVVAYEFTDFQCRTLSPFAWLNCAGRTLPEMKKLLRDRGGKPQRTTEVVRELDLEATGTIDSRTIDSVVCPDHCPTFQVELTWEDGHPFGYSSVVIGPRDHLDSKWTF